MNDDNTSLDQLHDILLAPPPPWWPLAPGWYALATVLLISAAWFGYRAWHRYRCDRYRRAALAELTLIEVSSSRAELAGLPGLLKRTALHAFSRKQVAALSGDEWRSFLNRHCEGAPFDGEAGELLLMLAYHPVQAATQDLRPLINGIRTWIRQHRAEPC